MTLDEYAAAARAARAEADAAHAALLADRAEVRALLAADAERWVAMLDGPAWRSTGPPSPDAAGLALHFLREARTRLREVGMRSPTPTELRDYARELARGRSPNQLLLLLRAHRSARLL